MSAAYLSCGGFISRGICNNRATPSFRGTESACNITQLHGQSYAPIPHLEEPYRGVALSQTVLCTYQYGMPHLYKEWAGGVNYGPRYKRCGLVWRSASQRSRGHAIGFIKDQTYVGHGTWYTPGFGCGVGLHIIVRLSHTCIVPELAKWLETRIYVPPYCATLQTPSPAAVHLASHPQSHPN